MAFPALTAPFRVANTALPPQLALLCRLLALAFLATGQLALIQSPYLPYLDIPADPQSGPWFQRALQLWALLAAIGLLFTTRVRTFALLLAAAIAAAHLASRAYQPPGLALAASLLTLSALSAQNGAPRLLFAQYALLYMHPASRPVEWILAASAAAASLPAGRAATIAQTLAVWGSAIYQCFLLYETGPDNGFHFLSAQAGLLTFLPWPKTIAVFYDGACGFCAASRRLASRFDFDGLFDWRAQHSGAPADFCPAPSQARGSLATETAGHIRRGYLAWRDMTAHLPAAGFAAMLALALAPTLQARLALAAVLLFVLSPLSNFIGEPFYRLIARHRHKFLPALNSNQ